MAVAHIIIEGGEDGDFEFIDEDDIEDLDDVEYYDLEEVDNQNDR